MARFVEQTFKDRGLQVQWQQVEEGRANVLGTLRRGRAAAGAVFNGHMDTSYSGREPCSPTCRGSSRTRSSGGPALRARDLEH